MKHSSKEFRSPDTSQGLGVKVFADGASVAEMLAVYRHGGIGGFTTNPTLMRRAGVTDYAAFAKALLAEVPDLPVSFEVFSDEFEEMRQQALRISRWGENVYVKIPICNTRGESSLELIEELSAAGVKVNVTAILTLQQAEGAIAAIADQTPAVISIFAGRIADTGLDPMPVMRAAVAAAAAKPKIEVLWASVREVLNVYQAGLCGCHIVTVPPDLLKKLDMRGMDLDALSLETVAMFRRDAVSAGYAL